MNTGKSLFAQLMDFVPWTSVARIVQRHGGDRRVRSFNCAEQFRVMAFAQLTWRESLRDIEAVLGANTSKLYGMGLRHAVRRSTLADANESRDWRIWADVAALLIRRARKLYASKPLGLELEKWGREKWGRAPLIAFDADQLWRRPGAQRPPASYSDRGVGCDCCSTPVTSSCCSSCGEMGPCPINCFGAVQRWRCDAGESSPPFVVG